MMLHMSHEEYVQSVRYQAVEICLGILAGSANLLEGYHSLASLRREVEVDERDPDLLTFAAISAEVDALTVGEIRKHWAPEVLARVEPDIRSAIAWASPLALPACRSVVQWFGA